VVTSGGAGGADATGAESVATAGAGGTSSDAAGAGGVSAAPNAGAPNAGAPNPGTPDAGATAVPDDSQPAPNAWQSIDGSPAEWLSPSGRLSGALISDLGDYEDLVIDSGGNVVLVGGGLVHKYSPSGQWLWTSLTDGDTDRVDVDGEDNIVVSLVASGDLIAGGDSQQDIFALRKYAPDGSDVWTLAPEGGPGYWPFAVGPAGEVVFVHDDAFVAKYSAEGELAWDQRVDEALGSLVSEVAVDDDGNIFVAGGENETSWLGKVSATGEPEWSRELFATSQNFRIVELVVGPDGNPVVGVSSYDDLDGDGADFDESTLIKYSSSGDRLWLRVLPPEDIKHMYDLDVDPSGNLVAVSGITSPNTWDAYVDVTSPDGTVLWGDRLAPSQFIDLFRVAAGAPGHAYVLVARSVVAHLPPADSLP
jgi:hypothetical protein